MRLVAVACIKNEIDIVEAFVRHTLSHVDRLVVLDNGSTDGTLNVLRALKNEGLELDITEDPSIGKYQARRTKRLMQDFAIRRHDADWVLLLDCDELLSVAEGTQIVPEGSDDRRPIAMPWRTYVIMDTDDQSEINPTVRIRHWRSADLDNLAKQIVPKSLASLPEIEVVQGNHGVLLNGEKCKPVISENVHLAHFPLRSLWQYKMRIAVNSLQYQAMAGRSVYHGWHYKEPFEQLKNDIAAFNNGFAMKALRYGLRDSMPFDMSMVTEEPLVYRGGELKYTPWVDGDTAVLQAVLIHAEKLAQQHAILTAGMTENDLQSAEQEAASLAKIHQELEERRKFYDTRIKNKTRTPFEEVQQTWTWRVGRMIVGPASQIKRLISFKKRPAIKKAA